MEMAIKYKYASDDERARTCLKTLPNTITSRAYFEKRIVQISDSIELDSDVMRCSIEINT